MGEHVAGLVMLLVVIVIFGWRSYSSIRTGVFGGGMSIPAIPRAVSPGLYWFFVGLQIVAVGACGFGVVTESMNLVPSLSSRLPATYRYGGLTGPAAIELVNARLGSDPCVRAMNLGDVVEKQFSRSGEEAEMLAEIHLGPVASHPQSLAARPCYVRNRMVWLADVGPAIGQGRQVTATEPFEFKLTDTGWKLMETSDVQGP